MKDPAEVYRLIHSYAGGVDRDPLTDNAARDALAWDLKRCRQAAALLRQHEVQTRAKADEFAAGAAAVEARATQLYTALNIFKGGEP